jgi:predicted site-specific integrase-resolvase
MAYKPVLVTAELAAYHLHRLGVRRISGATIRQWARRGHIRVHRGGYARYDLREIEEHARQKGLLDN